MKKLLVLILFLTSQIVTSQMSYEFSRKQHFWNEAKIAGIMIGEVTLSAISDGLYDNGYKLESKVIELVAKGLLAYGVREIIIQQGDFGRALVKYVGFRVSLYDFSYNITRGLPLGYIGTTSIWDKARQEFNPPSGMQYWSHSVYFTFSLTFPINQF